MRMVEGVVMGMRMFMDMVVGMVVVVGMRVLLFLFPVRLALFPGHIVGMLLLTVHRYMNLRARHAALFDVAALEAHPGQAQRVHPGDKALRIGEQFGKRGHQHVPRRAHIAFDVKRLHASSIPFMRLIRLAR